MPLKYLEGKDVELDESRRKARLLGIAHELYVQRVEDKGTDYIQDKYITKYGAKLRQKKIDSGNREKDGSIIWTMLDEYMLELDDSSDDYSKMISIHRELCKDDRQITLTEWG